MLQATTHLRINSLTRTRSIKALRDALLLCLILTTAFGTRAQTGNNLAPGAPGNDAHWPSAGKTAIGTSNSIASKVWFTLGDGVMTEIYYPTVDVANTQKLEFIAVSVDRTRFERESEDTTHHIETLDPQALSFRQTNLAKSGAYRIVKTYTTLPT